MILQAQLTQLGGYHAALSNGVTLIALFCCLACIAQKTAGVNRKVALLLVICHLSGS